MPDAAQTFAVVSAGVFLAYRLSDQHVRAPPVLSGLVNDDAVLATNDNDFRCNFVTLDAARLDVATLATTLSAAEEPHLVTNFAQGGASPRSSEEILAEHGSIPIYAGTGAQIAHHGPDARVPGAAITTLRDYSRAVAANDAYVFHDVADSALAAELSPMRELWEAIANARHPERRTASNATMHALRPAVRIGAGQPSSGVAFHLHEPALNLVLAGRKRWFVYDSRAAARLDSRFFAAADGTPLPMDTFARHVFPSQHFQRVWTAREGENGGEGEVGRGGRGGRDAWHCAQRSGEMVWLPPQLRHGTLNTEEPPAASSDGDPGSGSPPPATRLTLAVAMQFDNHGASPLHLAAHRGDASAVEELLQLGGRPDARAAHGGLTPLHAAAIAGHASAASALVRYDSSLARALDDGGSSPRHTVCARGGADDLVAALVPEARLRCAAIGWLPAALRGAAAAALLP